MNLLTSSIILLLALTYIAWSKPKEKHRLFYSWQKNIIFDRDKQICQYCGIKCKAYGKDKDSVEFDHFYPFWLVKETDTDNGITSCRQCNQFKSGKIYKLEKLIKKHKHLVAYKKRKGL